MGVWSETSYLIGCDVEECEDTLNDEFGDVHFYEKTLAVDYARSLGWEVAGEYPYPDVYCPNCAKIRKRTADGKLELPQINP